MNIKAKLKVDEYPELTGKCGGVVATVKGNLPLERATGAPTDQKTVYEQLARLGGSGFELDGLKLETDGAFIAKSVLNALRRELAEELKKEIILANERNITARFDEKAYRNLFSENAKIIEDCKESECGKRLVYRAYGKPFDCAAEADDIAVISPSVYCAAEIEKLLKEAAGYGEFALELPVIATTEETNEIKKLLAQFEKIKYVVSGNFYGLAFTESGCNVIAGELMNVENSFSALALELCGACGIQRSEKFPGGAYRAVNYKKPLMTLAHCPYRNLYKTDCQRCKYSSGLKLKRAGREYAVERVKIKNCYFKLYSD